jgi:hypothetical protein
MLSLALGVGRCGGGERQGGDGETVDGVASAHEASSWWRISGHEEARTMRSGASVGDDVPAPVTPTV